VFCRHFVLFFVFFASLDPSLPANDRSGKVRFEKTFRS